MITACSKKANNGLGGTWSFKSVNYAATSFATGFSLVTVTNQPTPYTDNYTTLTVNFYNGLPYTNNATYSGTYVVEGGNLDSINQVSISMNNAGTSTELYRSNGGNGNQTVYVTLNDGNISISGSAITLANVNDPTDSGSLTLNVAHP
jgi:hypothetical protein